MSYAQLIKKYPKPLSYGFLLCFFSGLGQTFLIALFVPHFRQVFSLDNMAFGLFYSQATLVSGLLIPFIGPYIDSVSLKAFSFVTGIGLFVSTIMLGMSQILPLLFLGLVLQRLFGQGLMTHIYATAFGRYFIQNRGRALSVGALGYPLSEAILPVLVATAIVGLGWRNTLFILAASVLVVFLPLSRFLVFEEERFNKDRFSKKQHKTTEVGNSSDWDRKKMLRHPFFYLVTPFTLIPPFILTGFFIHQGTWIHFKNWSLSTFATGFIFFALSRVMFSFLLGPWVDRWTGKRLLPFTLIPLALGIGCLSLGNSPVFAFLFLGFSGMTIGAGSTIKSAMWPEVYGVKHLGAIRSTTTPLVIFATAASPFIFGWYFDNFESLNPLVYVSLAGIVVSTLLVILAPVPKR